MAHYLVYLCLMIFASKAWLAHAEVLRDPTMPPVQLEQAASGVVLPSGPVLQSVMLSTHQKAAIINGQYVKLGKKYEDSVLIRVSETEAVLRAPNGEKQVLRIAYPVQKKPVIVPMTAMQKVRSKTSPQDVTVQNNNKREAL